MATPQEKAEATVRAYCGWHIAPVRTDDVLVMDGSGATVQQLPSLRVTAVSEVTNDGTVLDVVNDLEWSADGYMRVPGRWTHKLRGVTAKITHGYATMPDEVQAVIDDLIARENSNPGAAQQVGQVRFAVSLVSGAALGGALSPYEKEKLNTYRLPDMP